MFQLYSNVKGFLIFKGDYDKNRKKATPKGFLQITIILLYLEFSITT